MDGLVSGSALTVLTTGSAVTCVRYVADTCTPGAGTP